MNLKPAIETILETLGAMAVPGATGKQLEAAATHLFSLLKVEPVFNNPELNKARSHPKGEVYPTIICVSINNEVIHGIPDDRKFQDGDVVKIDTGVLEDGLIYDAAISVLIGTPEVDKDGHPTGRIFGTSVAARKVVKATQEALEAGIAAAKAGNTNLTITQAIEAVAKKYDLNVVHGYGGHGIGADLHQDPYIANRAADVKGDPFKLESGMRIAIEPMFTTTRGECGVASNGWTVKTLSGYTAHFERTITIP